MKGFKKDGKFRPTENNNHRVSSHHIRNKNSLSHSSGDANELKLKKLAKKLPHFHIRENNYGFSNDEDGIRLQLGNMTDAGWYWSGDENDLIGYLIRMYGSEEGEGLYTDLKNKLAKENVTFEDLKPLMLKSVKDQDGLYQISGDNTRWKFGSDNFLEADMENEIDYRSDEGSLDDEDKDELQSLAWNHVKEKSFEEYAKEEGKEWEEMLTKAIMDSETFDDFGRELDGLNSAYLDERMEEVGEIITEAVAEAYDELMKNHPDRYSKNNTV